MNVLAHLALGARDPGLLVGGFLGDFLRGPVPDRLPPPVAAGVRLHRALDAWSGRHPPILATLATCPPAGRRLAPVALDVIADHALALHFERLHGGPLPAFSQRALAELDAADRHLVPAARRFRDRIREVDLLCGYRDPAVVVRSLDWLGRRSARPAVQAGMQACIGWFEQQRELLVAEVLGWYPDAQVFSVGQKSW